MSTLSITGSGLGSQLTELMNADTIEPGSDPSYQICKTLYLYHPLGGKMVDGPVKLAQSQQRVISIPNGPEEKVREAFLAEWGRLRCDAHILGVMTSARTYGIGSVIFGAPNIPTDEPIDLAKLPDLDLYFNVLDPMNTAGSLTLNQDPNSPDFQKVQGVAVAGQPYHRSRACVVMNENPVYIAFTSSSFGFVGRSVFQRALFPLKSFIQSMLTDDSVTLKAGAIVAKMKPAGSIINNLMQKATDIKRGLLQQAQTGNVISISETESIETLDMTNVNTAMSESRKNILENIASAADMPAKLLNGETFAEGFGEGTEDAKAVARYIENLRGSMTDLYAFFDVIVQYRAWNPQFYAAIQAEFPEYAHVDFNTAFYQWKNSFTAEWPSFLIEPESEKVKVEDIKFKAIVSILEIMLPQADPENKARVVQWAADNLNENKLMFTTPLEIDAQAMAEYEPPQPPAPAPEAPPPYSNGSRTV